MFYYIFQFVVGGSSVIGMTLISKYIDPKYSGIVYAFPIILITSSIFIYLAHGTEMSQKALKSTFIYEFTLIYFILTFWFLLYKINFWGALSISLFSWIFLILIIHYLNS